MSNTPKDQPAAALDASISVLGEEAGEPKVAAIDGPAGTPSGAGRATGSESGRQETLEAPIEESAVDGAGGAPGRVRGADTVEESDADAHAAGYEGP